MLIRVILALRDAKQRQKIRTAISGPNVVVDLVQHTRDLWERLSRESGDFIVADRSLIPSPVLDTIRFIREAPESPEIVVISTENDPADRARLLAAGCDTVLSLDVPADVLADLFSSLFKRRRERVTERLPGHGFDETPRISDFVSASPAMQAFMDVVERVIPSDASILILGETGAGKERLARAMHAESRRSTGPFVTVNCGALPETLMESELFGHEEGSFTGATRSRRGWFELAHGGTIFLDEIGDLPSHLQVKLLRVLQNREIQRVGGERLLKVDARVMAATNLDLPAEIARGRFRKDLFYRLGVVTLTLPSLRERWEDIPGLVENHVDYFCHAIGRDVDGVTGEAMEALCAYDWPGNVRELSNVIERAVLLCRSDRISLEDLPGAIRGRPDGGASPPFRFDAPPSGTGDDALLDRPLELVRKEAVRRLEATYLDAMLRRTRGRVGEAARRSGISTRSLYGKMRDLGLRKENYRGGGGDEEAF